MNFGFSHPILDAAGGSQADPSCGDLRGGGRARTSSRHEWDRDSEDGDVVDGMFADSIDPPLRVSSTAPPHATAEQDCANKRLPSPPYPGIDTTELDSGPQGLGLRDSRGADDFFNASTSGNNDHDNNNSGSSSAFKGLGCLGDNDMAHSRTAGGDGSCGGRSRSASLHELDDKHAADANAGAELEFFGDSAGASVCDLGWGTLAKDFEALDCGRERGGDAALLESDQQEDEEERCRQVDLSGR